MRIILAGGGTAGHINPAIAIANQIKATIPDAEIAFIGTKRGMENTLVAKAGYPLHHIEIQGLQKRISLSTIKTAYYYFTSPQKAKKLIREFKPDIVLGTGGYLSWPLLKAAHAMGIPSAVHESNAIPGRAVRMVEKMVDRIYINFPSTAEAFAPSSQEKIRCVGNPLISPPDISKEMGLREKLEIPPTARKIVLSFGGSLGAERVNEEILALMRDHIVKDPTIFHIHATGKIEYEAAMAKAEEYGLLNCPNIRLVEYIYDMPLWEKIADVVICRAGAMTLAEMAMLEKACIIIPSPNVAHNHQYENAKRLADNGAAIMIEEKDISTELLRQHLCNILEHPDVARQMQSSIRHFSHPCAAEEILKDLQTLCRS